MKLWEYKIPKIEVLAEDAENKEADYPQNDDSVGNRVWNVLINDDFQILKTKWIKRIWRDKVIIGAVTGKSWLHVRPSNVLFLEINRLKSKHTSSFNVTLLDSETGESKLVEWAMDILSLDLRIDKNFEITLEWADISDELVNDFVKTLNWLETDSIAWCESVITAISRILWKNF